LGGAGLASLVLIANRSEATRESSLHTIRTLEKQNATLLLNVVELQDQLAQAKLELKLERQNKFATNQQKNAETKDDSAEANDEDNTSEQHADPKPEPKKRGAPVGHPGWFRPTPTEYDWAIDVPAPRFCPNCKRETRVLIGVEPSIHLQEDIVDGPEARQG
jgi:hypothetical protein